MGVITANIVISIFIWVIAFHCCSSFRYGLSCLYESENRQFRQIRQLEFGKIDEHVFGQIQFSQIQCNHPLSCGFADSLQEWSLGIISNMATVRDCIQNYVLNIERWLESGNYNMDGFDYIVFRLD